MVSIACWTFQRLRALLAWNPWTYSRGDILLNGNVVTDSAELSLEPDA